MTWPIWLAHLPATEPTDSLRFHARFQDLPRRMGTPGRDTGTIDCEFRGAAGQSFGAFLISGVNFRLLGEAMTMSAKA